MMLKLFPKLVKKQYDPLAMIIGSFLMIILLGSILLCLPMSSRSHEWTNFLDAAFTATSATTVTGLAVYDTGTYWSFVGQLIILILIHLGGLGYMTIIASIFILIRKRSINDALILGESLNTYSFKEIFNLAKSLFLVVIVLEGIGALALFVDWAPEIGIKRALWYGIFHSIAAFNNAGFDLMGGFKGLTNYVGDPIVNITIMGLIITGGLGFFVFLELFHWVKSNGRLSLHAKIVLTTTCFLILFGALVIYGFEHENPKTLGELPTTSKIWASLFLSVTARTAGFNTIPTEGLRDESLLFVMILMLIGASPGGTGGGVKTTTMAVIFFTILAYIENKKDTEIGRRRIEDSTVRKAYSIMVLAIIFITVFTFGILALDKHTLLPVAFETASAFGTVGLTTGIIPYLNEFSKAILMAAMFIGRIGSLSIVLVFVRKNFCSAVVKPAEHISIG